MALTEEGKKHVQAYGSQHPDFHSKEMKEHRSKAKSEALKKKKEKDTFNSDYHHFVRHHSSAEIGERWRKEWDKKK